MAAFTLPLKQPAVGNVAYGGKGESELIGMMYNSKHLGP